MSKRQVAAPEGPPKKKAKKHQQRAPEPSKEGTFYSSLDAQLVPKGKAVPLETFVRSLLPPTARNDLQDGTIQREVLDKPIFLDRRTDNRKVPKVKKPKKMPSREMKAKKIFDIPEEDQRYENFLPLNALWLQYITGLMAKSIANPQEFGQKLLKADFHGAMCKVTQASEPSFVGVGGILLQETAKTFKIITPENKLKVIPKNKTVFTFVIVNKVVNLYGSQFSVRSAERAGKKFKAKETLDF